MHRRNLLKAIGLVPVAALASTLPATALPKLNVDSRTGDIRIGSPPGPYMTFSAGATTVFDNYGNVRVKVGHW